MANPGIVIMMTRHVATSTQAVSPAFSRAVWAEAGVAMPHNEPKQAIHHPMLFISMSNQPPCLLFSHNQQANCMPIEQQVNLLLSIVIFDDINGSC